LCWRITSMTMCQNAKLSPVYGIHWSRSAIVYTDCILSKQKETFFLPKLNQVHAVCNKSDRRHLTWKMFFSALHLVYLLLCFIRI
jgi:hypothetical protein